jgi:predicted chitinase
MMNADCKSNSSGAVPLKDLLNNDAVANLEKYLTEKEWDQLFPNRFGKNKSDSQHVNNDFYSFQAFTAAAKLFPSFLNNGNEETNKRELAAFLANIAQETSGGWDSAPGGYFKWGLYFVEEKQEGITNSYVDSTRLTYRPVPGKLYYGRGPKQLSWNYNYGQFSEAWFGTRDSLLQKPELLAQNPIISFASAIWFWTTPQPPKPSCHDIIALKWKPTPDDEKKGRLAGFGAIVNVINGGVECGKGKDLKKTSYRYEYYQYFCKYFNASAGENIYCTNQQPFGQ